MPDSLQPIQGPASYGERDLDALLSGEAGYPVIVPGPVAGVLAALRAAPAPDELDGEAAARAAFRHFVRPEAGVAGGVHVSAPLSQVPAPLPPVPAPLHEVPVPFHQGRVAGAGRPDGLEPTVMLPRAVPSGPRHARHRHARQRQLVPWHGPWQVMAAACGAAAAVIIGVAALAGAFSGPSGQPGQSGQHQTSQASGTSSHRATSSVLGTATAPPTPRPSATSAATLCNQYMDFLKHPGQHANRPGEDAVVQQLTKLANGKMRIFGYCIRQLGMGEWHGYDTRFPGGEGDPGGGDPFGRGGSGEPGAKSTSAGPLKAGQTAR